MKLPNVERAFISKEKITDYLLSESHPDGRTKTIFFTRFGFTKLAWIAFAQALHEHASIHEVSKIVSSQHGTKYMVEGPLTTPDARNPDIRSVWIIEAGTDIPRLVTAYPLD